MRKFVIRKPSHQPTAHPPATQASEPEPAFDWSETELETLSTTSEDDVSECRAWLRRIGFIQAAEAL